MGMPITSFTVLKSLAEGMPGRDLDHVRSVLSPFTRFAFVIHDPRDHHDFDRAITRYFAQLDELTGDKLLFFALVDPGESWRRGRASDRTYLDLAPLQDETFAPRTADPDVAAFALATSLGIPAEALPCVVTTHDFASPDYAWASVDANTVRPCLVDLGTAASIGRDAVPRSEFIQWNCVTTARSVQVPTLATRIATPLAFATVPDPHQDTWVASTALTHARRALRELVEQASEIGDEIQQLASTETAESTLGDRSVAFRHLLRMLEEFAQLIVACLSIPASSSEVGFHRGNSLAERLANVLERRSSLLLRTGERVANWFDSGEMTAWLDLSEDEEVDWTPSIVNFAKVFEHEIDLSVVHWARERKGIELPRYFNKVHPGAVAAVIPSIENARPIDLNAGRHGSWLPPSLGEAALACTALASEAPPEPWNGASWQSLMNHWRKIQRIRNSSLHTGEASEQDSRAIRTNLAELADEGHFDRFCELKSRYRG